MTKRFFRALLGGAAAAFTVLLALSALFGLLYLLSLVHGWGGTGAVAVVSVIIAAFVLGFLDALQKGKP